MNLPILSERELQALAYRVADDVETRALEIFNKTPITWDAAVDRAIHEISEKG